MCRRYELWGWLLIAFGVGVLCGIFLESGFLCSCIGVGMVAGGIVILQKK